MSMFGSEKQEGR